MHAGLRAGLLGWALACWPHWTKNSSVSALTRFLRPPASRSSGRFPQRPDERRCVERSGLPPTPHALAASGRQTPVQKFQAKALQGGQVPSHLMRSASHLLFPSHTLIGL